MKHSSRKSKSETGGALSGIIIIIVILLLGGFFFYQMTKKQTEENKINRERAAIPQNIPLDANASGAVQ